MKFNLFILVAICQSAFAQTATTTASAGGATTSSTGQVSNSNGNSNGEGEITTEPAAVLQIEWQYRRYGGKGHVEYPDADNGFEEPHVSGSFAGTNGEGYKEMTVGLVPDGQWIHNQLKGINWQIGPTTSISGFFQPVEEEIMDRIPLHWVYPYSSYTPFDVSFDSTFWHGDGYQSYIWYAKEIRFRVWRKLMSDIPVSIYFLQYISKGRNEPFEEYNPEVKVIHVEIAAGSMSTDWIEYSVPTPAYNHWAGSRDLLPVDLTGHRRGTFNAPGAVSTGGIYGKETVLLENADRDEGNATQRDLDTPTLDNAKDDDLVKVVLSFPADMRLSGVGLKLKHEGMKVDGTKKTFDSAVVREGASRLNFYDDQGNKLTDADLKIDDLANPGSGYMAKIVSAGTLTLFIEGADNFGMVGTSDQSATNAKYMGGALLTLEITGAGVATDSGPRLLVFRGGFFRYHQPNSQPGEIGTLEFCDGKGRITDTTTDNGAVIKSWSGRSGKTFGGDYDEPGESGHIPPGWRYIYKRSDFSATQRNREEGSGNSMTVKQGNYCRWLQDDNAPGYATSYLYKQSIEADRNIGKPSMPTTTSDSGQTVMFKFQTEVIPPNISQRSEIQFHPDGKKDGTAGCIGIQTYDTCKEVYRYLNDFKAMKLKVKLGTP